ncbi:2-acyl-glycerophospho-ethanolamine acyltransferase, putative [Babesia ovata]|uniref:2-acyl-glycerophospho-ethanolamine acyltransferase, putative n=1 Tax=Babesia ovata TaxID=189622 RepID=A0A2H6KJ46_9APIC|nr:2-acyl-glycerophospho-ethanolamine acyltransferase, putative [Babesia ovata]GBE63017.1 2-acyl-glycerophospho-ethanolamine acyltransferase, putative [Babesia ovata]
MVAQLTVLVSFGGGDNKSAFEEKCSYKGTLINFLAKPITLAIFQSLTKIYNGDVDMTQKCEQHLRATLAVVCQLRYWGCFFSRHFGFFSDLSHPLFNGLRPLVHVRVLLPELVGQWLEACSQGVKDGRDIPLAVCSGIKRAKWFVKCG